MPIRSATTVARIGQGVADKTSFASGALAGRRVRNIDRPETGQLTAYQAEVFYRLIRSGDLRYVVHSYDTPIAWWLPPTRGRDRGVWYVNRGRYSATTSDHQRVVRSAIDLEAETSPVVYLIDE